MCCYRTDLPSYNSVKATPLIFVLIPISLVTVKAISATSVVRLLLSNFSWEGEGPNEIGRDKTTGAIRVRVNPKFYRPTEVVSCCYLPIAGQQGMLLI